MQFMVHDVLDFGGHSILKLDGQHNLVIRRQPSVRFSEFTDDRLHQRGGSERLNGCHRPGAEITVEALDIPDTQGPGSLGDQRVHLTTIDFNHALGSGRDLLAGSKSAVDSA